jgi:hypothetical protein
MACLYRGSKLCPHVVFNLTWSEPPPHTLQQTLTVLDDKNQWEHHMILVR